MRGLRVSGCGRSQLLAQSRKEEHFLSLHGGHLCLVEGATTFSHVEGTAQSFQDTRRYCLQLAWSTLLGSLWGEDL